MARKQKFTRFGANPLPGHFRYWAGGGRGCWVNSIISTAEADKIVDIYAQFPLANPYRFNGGKEWFPVDAKLPAEAKQEILTILGERAGDDAWQLDVEDRMRSRNVPIPSYQMFATKEALDTWVNDTNEKVKVNVLSEEVVTVKDFSGEISQQLMVCYTLIH